MTKTITITLDKPNKKALLLRALEIHWHTIESKLRPSQGELVDRINLSLAEQTQELWDEVNDQ